MDSAAVIWFRRDLRLGDLPTLSASAGRAEQSLALFVLDDALLGPAGNPRKTFLFRTLRALEASLDGRLLVVHGDPVDVVPRVARAFSAGSVHVSADHGPYGARRDEAVEQALGEVELVRTGSPYAVAPGRVRKGDGEPFKVFTPFRRAWTEHGWRAPADTSAATLSWVDPDEKDGGPRRVRVPDDVTLGDTELPPAGEAAALARWVEFVDRDGGVGVTAYDEERNRPDHDATSRMSVYLKYGCIHPRTMLADLAGRTGTGAQTFTTELAWRDFYADVLHRRPDTAREHYDRRFDKIVYDTGAQAKDAFGSWATGRTGFPIVDAGMRQLLAQGWMHNRLRMIVASFLTKDLHLPWTWGARHFMRHLVDGDLASNQHGWQWTAGSGTDASPYFRVFNPTTQGEKFDPQGDYVRRWVPELRGVPGKAVHTLPDGVPPGYVGPMVDHKHERQVALDRYAALKG
ncbi:MAG: deoxyribodipyrimidine photo-lyase [Mycobacteriaceae bacterium]